MVCDSRNRRRWRETTAQKITQSFEESSASPLGVKMEKGEVKIEEELDFMDESESGIEFRKPSLSSSSFQATYVKVQPLSSKVNRS